jgi:3-hydroxyacyl-CoA dehydrogenase
MQIKKIAIVGSGLIGRSWALLLARSGYPVTMYDINKEAFIKVRQFLIDALNTLSSKCLLSPENFQSISDLVVVTDDLAQALYGADYIIEAVTENIEIKQSLYAKMEEIAGSNAIIASSTSSFPISLITARMVNPERCLVAHPFNPPHLIPVVEVVPGPGTATDVVDITMEFLKSIGKIPVLCNKETKGFILNRLQNALLRECINLIDNGVATVADVDAAVSAGIGLRWALMGPFEVFDLASDSGLKGFFEHFKPVLEESWQQERNKKLDSEIITKIIEQFNAVDRPEKLKRIKNRDEMLIDLLKIKKQI